MAMVRTRVANGGTMPMRLVYSTRTPDTVLYGDELRRLAEREPQLDVELVYTRRAPEGRRRRGMGRARGAPAREDGEAQGSG